MPEKCNITLIIIKASGLCYYLFYAVRIAKFTHFLVQNKRFSGCSEVCFEEINCRYIVEYKDLNLDSIVVSFYLIQGCFGISS